MGANRTLLPFPPHDLLDGASLFLDLDGTLLDIANRPDEVRADAGLVDLLARTSAALDGRIAVISGRSLEQIDAILGDAAAGLAVSGSHGCEHRWNGVLTRPERPEALDRAAERFRRFAQGREGLVVEDKTLGVALHYRLNPALEDEAHTIAQAAAADLGLQLQPGKMMVELRVAGGGKDGAVIGLMDQPRMRGTRPVFAGDDLTDEPGFAAARRLGGHGILVGPPRPTAADYAVSSPSGLRKWLAEVIA